MAALYLIANWKMNPDSLGEARKLALTVEKGISKFKNRKNIQIILCPPFPHLSIVKSQLSIVALGAQNCHFENLGAFTGEVSASMLKDIGCEYIIVGHSERRAMGEDDTIINRKIRAILKNKISPVLAVGEKTRESFNVHGRWTGEPDRAIREQIRVALNGISAANAKRLIIAYEPVWAIGTGNAAGADDVFSVRLFIQKILRELYSPAVQKSIPIIYGGSTSSKNIASFVRDAHMDGALVGGASLNAEEFIKMGEALKSLK